MLILCAIERFDQDIIDELRVIRKDISEHQEHIKALEEGVSFEPKFPSGERKSRKRKSSGGNKKGSPKRRRTDEDSLAEEELDEMLLDPDADIDEDDFIDDRSSVSEKSGGDSDSDSSRKSSDEDSDDDQDDDDDDTEEVEKHLTIDDVKAKLTAKKEELTTARGRLNEARKSRKDAIDMISGLEKTKAKTQREKNGYCSLKRSEVSTKCRRVYDLLHCV